MKPIIFYPMTPTTDVIDRLENSYYWADVLPFSSVAFFRLPILYSYPTMITKSISCGEPMSLR
jgi:hypothetical protein